MTHFHYTYDLELQCLVKSSTEGRELQRFFIPRSDIEKVLASLWNASYSKVFIEGE